MYEDKPEFLGGREGGVQKKKNLQWGEYGYFRELHNVLSGVHYVLSGVIGYLNDIDMKVPILWPFIKGTSNKYVK